MCVYSARHAATCHVYAHIHEHAHVMHTYVSGRHVHKPARMHVSYMYMHVIYACQAATEELTMAIEAAKQTRDAALLSKPIKRGRKVLNLQTFLT